MVVVVVVVRSEVKATIFPSMGELAAVTSAAASPKLSVLEEAGAEVVVVGKGVVLVVLVEEEADLASVPHESGIFTGFLSILLQLMLLLTTSYYHHHRWWLLFPKYSSPVMGEGQDHA